MEVAPLGRMKLGLLMNERFTCHTEAQLKPRRHFALLCQFFRDDSAQDLVEYALITAFVGVVGFLVLRAIGGEVFNTYSSWLSPASGVPSRWDPPDPVGGGS